VKVTQKGEKAEKIRDFSCNEAKFQGFRIAIFLEILTDFLTSLDIFGHTLGTIREVASNRAFAIFFKSI
jgi:hypothetical protein